ncbi:Tetraacyldisaccharide 4'-kinase [hydrothermal vent metagenome]|uniref:tetraacyldisaccharide 4'-kinase n=1 Tax=hydrothermal vent metagenome TaxID=652676 RepID=A0A3B1ADH3_9ZZZZ
MIKHIQNSWYNQSKITFFLKPLSWLFCCVVFFRSYLYRFNILKSYKLNVPVIIVGNLTVGGNGKTPLVIWLANKLKQSGYRPGIISRGYGGLAKKWPQQVRPDSDPSIVGDEAIVISRQTACPMAVGPNRVETGRALVKYSNCDIVISDDGMQHYRLKRDIEIAVINNNTKFGNELCLPAGPLREPISRLELVNFVVMNGGENDNAYNMQYKGTKLHSLRSDEIIDLSEFENQRVHAVVAIANPECFFLNLQQKNMKLVKHVYLDHYSFKAIDLEFEDDFPIIMTEKDAVKCHRFDIKNCWYLPIECEISNSLELSILNKLEN